MENKDIKGKSLTEYIGQVLSVKLNCFLKKEGIDLLKLERGINIVLINIEKFIVVFAIAIYFKIFFEALFMSMVFGFIRIKAFGIHAKNSITCTIASILMFDLGAYLSRFINLNNYILFFIFIILNILICKYAPADTEKLPLINKNKRKILKRQASIRGIIIMVLALSIPDNHIKALMVLAFIFSTIMILPITYKIFNRRYKNYEEFI